MALIDDLNTTLSDAQTQVNALAVAFASEPTNAQLQAAIVTAGAIRDTAANALNPTPPPAPPQAKH